MAILVIGLGSLLRRDDGVGRVVAEELSGRHADWEVVSSVQLLPEHAEACAAAAEVFIVDAARDVAVGTVEVREVAGVREVRGVGAADGRQSPRIHRFGPEQILGMARSVFGWTGRARLVCVGCGDFGLGEGLSESAGAAVGLAVDRIEAMVEKCGHARVVAKPVHP
jgi:hydrogenase maturation protease